MHFDIFKCCFFLLFYLQTLVYVRSQLYSQFICCSFLTTKQNQHIYVLPNNMMFFAYNRWQHDDFFIFDLFFFSSYVKCSFLWEFEFDCQLEWLSRIDKMYQYVIGFPSQLFKVVEIWNNFNRFFWDNTFLLHQKFQIHDHSIILSDHFHSTW